MVAAEGVEGEDENVHVAASGPTAARFFAMCSFISRLKAP